MKTESGISKKYFTTAAIWCTALLLVVLVGVMAFFSAASQKTENKGIGGAEKTGQGTEAVTEQSGKTKQTVKQDEKQAKETDLAGAEPFAEDAAAPLMGEDIPASALPDDTKIPAATYPEVSVPFTCIMPVNGTVTKAYTEDIAVYSLTMNDYRVHSGVDIYAPIGTRVAACADGTVERVWEDPFLGACVLINHGGEMRSLYCNLSPDRPKGMEAGATVLAGDIIGGVGGSMAIEMADSDHLHFAVTENGVYKNPMDYVTNYRDADSDYDE